MKAVVAAFNQEKALVGAFSVITNLRMQLFEALVSRHDPEMWGFLVCPICQFKAYDDHPGDMKKHIMFEHDKEESWAKDNMIVDVSEKLKRFRKLTTKEVVRLDGRKVNTFEGVEKVAILVTAPAIRASFTPTSPTYLICGVAGCDKLCESVYKLKIHYERHDVSLQRERFECVLCPAVEDKVKRMRRHVEKDHPEVRAANEPLRSLKLYNHRGLLHDYMTSNFANARFKLYRRCCSWWRRGRSSGAWCAARSGGGSPRRWTRSWSPPAASGATRRSRRSSRRCT